MELSSWLKSNSWAIMIAVVAIASTWGLYGYRIGQIEVRLEKNEQLLERYTDTQVANQITLAQIQKDIEFIRVQLVKITE